MLAVVCVLFSNDISLVGDLSTITYAGSIISGLLVAFYSDIRGNRWEMLLECDLFLVVANIILMVWNVPVGAKFFAFMALGVAQEVLPICVFLGSLSLLCMTWKFKPLVC